MSERTCTLKEAAHELWVKYQGCLGGTIAGIGIGADKIVIYAISLADPHTPKFPAEWMGWPVEVRESGEFSLARGDE